MSFGAVVEEMFSDISSRSSSSDESEKHQRATMLDTYDSRPTTKGNSFSIWNFSGGTLLVFQVDFNYFRNTMQASLR